MIHQFVHQFIADVPAFIGLGLMAFLSVMLVRKNITEERRFPLECPFCYQTISYGGTTAERAELADAHRQDGICPMLAHTNTNIKIERSDPHGKRTALEGPRDRQVPEGLA